MRISGAALVCVRKGYDVGKDRILERQLQRGRTRVSAEGRYYGTGDDSMDRASTGPHSCECGRSDASQAKGKPASGFNGAALV